jgi:leucyl aminopeptidase (aminopeptidase T)
VDLPAIAARVVEDCAGVRAGERALVVTDATTPAPLAEHLLTALRLRGADASRIAIPPVPVQPHGYLSWQEPTPVLTAALAAADVAIVHMPALIVLSRAVAAARVAGTRLLFVPGDFDLSRPLLLEEDLDAMSALGAAVCARLEGASSAELRTPDGTHLRFGALHGAFHDDARARDPGEADFFPGGMWNVIPELDGVEGVVRFTAALHPVGRLVEPVELELERGRIRAVRGGWQARAWERWLDGFGDEELRSFSHLSGGLAATARVVGHDWEDLIVRGSVLVSGGENVLYGGENRARGHFDGIVVDATLAVDGEVLIEDGEYRVPVPAA